MALKRIVLHWTAGSYNVSAADRTHYHYIIDGDGRVVKGHHTVEANESTRDGVYAAHTQGCNTGAIGVAMAAMKDAQEQPFKPGRFPLLKHQWEEAVEWCAFLAEQHGIAVSRETILSHAEVEPTLGIKQRGKWDIAVLPWDPSLKGALAIGDRFRAEVRAAMAKAKSRPQMLLEQKPLLSHRRVQTLIGSLGGASGIVGMFTGFDWRALAVMAIFAVVMALLFRWLYRHEFQAGIFSKPAAE
jgi:N-acetyl-anhydromuramyl-L-alanine amidase AmpD